MKTKIIITTLALLFGTLNNNTKALTNENIKNRKEPIKPEFTKYISEQSFLSLDEKDTNSSKIDINGLIISAANDYVFYLPETISKKIKKYIEETNTDNSSIRSYIISKINIINYLRNTDFDNKTIEFKVKK